jgi:shikimate dehydrogenase
VPLHERGTEVVSFGRKTLEEFNGGVDIVINCTPVRMKGENEGKSPVRNLEGVKLVYDLVYNPEETELLRIARANGCETIGGLQMLYAQAEEQYRLWRKGPGISGQGSGEEHLPFEIGEI